MNDPRVTMLYQLRLSQHMVIQVINFVDYSCLGTKIKVHQLGTQSIIDHIVVLSSFCHRSHLSQLTRLLSFIFGVDCTYTINKVIVLSGFCLGAHLVRLIMITQFRFRVDRTCTIGHVVVLSGFCHRSYLVQLVTVTQFHFRCRPCLYTRSCRCLIHS